MNKRLNEDLYRYQRKFFVDLIYINNFMVFSLYDGVIDVFFCVLDFGSNQLQLRKGSKFILRSFMWYELGN